jgi:putative membrane protein
VTYLWLKVLHILAVVSWMAGMLYLPRLFVYHSGVGRGSPEALLFEVMEYRLMRFIMSPAIVVVWVSGLYLAVSAQYILEPWLLLKMFFVILMTVAHGYFSLLRKDLVSGVRQKSSKFFRVLNEVPTVLLIFVVVLVVVKPFS